MKLTKAQREALEKLAKAPCTPWDFGATTVSVLRRNKLIESYPTGSAVFAGTLRITPAGRKALEES